MRKWVRKLGVGSWGLRDYLLSSHFHTHFLTQKLISNLQKGGDIIIIKDIWRLGFYGLVVMIN
ncbi:MAG: hypothetical protein ABIL44_10470, partial [candidate division WOR-3 bacterium]